VGERRDPAADEGHEGDETCVHGALLLNRSFPEPGR
jgi:hypothetical protein